MRADPALPAHPGECGFAFKERTNNLTTFSEFDLNPAILETLRAKAMRHRRVQVQAIPHVLEGRDLQGLAQTGTGKTAAFALPILHRLLTDSRARRCGVAVAAGPHTHA